MAQRRGLPVAAALAGAVALAGGAHATSTKPKPHCGKAPKPHFAARSEPRPTRKLDPRKTYDVTLATNCGNFTIRLAVRTSPHVTASFVDLVRRHFFDGTVFHRIAVGFVIQGGDPTGTGGGGPGYSTVDKPPASARYTVGTVAMAKTQTDPPGTSGSQFFVATGQSAAQLPPDYAVLGHVVRGQAVVALIGRLGDAQELPTRLVEIEHATVAVR